MPEATRDIALQARERANAAHARAGRFEKKLDDIATEVVVASSEIVGLSATVRTYGRVGGAIGGVLLSVLTALTIWNATRSIPPANPAEPHQAATARR